ncbi:hypothetical protein V8F33_010106 [Rhypophila sp. PSN 637]
MMVCSWLRVSVIKVALCLVFFNLVLAQSRARGPRTGNWTALGCNDPSGVNLRELTPQERWSRLGCPHAWKDVINTWKKIDRPNGLRFTHSISDNLNSSDGANCGILAPSKLCDWTQCNSVMRPGSGPAAYLVWNSLVQIHYLFVDMHHELLTLRKRLRRNPGSIRHMASDSSRPRGAGANRGRRLIHQQVSGQETVTDGADTLVKDTSFALYAALCIRYQGHGYHEAPRVGFDFSVCICCVFFYHDLTLTLLTRARWTPESQATFTDYLIQAFKAWGSSTERAVSRAFSGDDAAIEALTLLISDGKWIEGWGGNRTIPNDPDKNNSDGVAWVLTRAFYAYAIPAIWAVSGIHAFVLDSGYPCGATDPMDQYIINTDTQHATWACFQDKLYYLVAPIGKSQDCLETICSSNTFSTPPGLDLLLGSSLGSSPFHDISVHDFIEGAVRTYMANGNRNGAPPMDPVSRDAFEDIVNHDIHAPGYIRLPVCRPDVAFQGWDRGDVKAPDYPCST